MSKILDSVLANAPFMIEVVRILTNMYNQRWDERNGGNLSMMLDESEFKDYITGEVKRTIPIDFDAKELIGKVFLVTGTGKYFKNMQYDPEDNLGIIRIGKDGKTAELLWGYNDGGSFTSELPAHLMSHIERLKIDPNQKVVIHTHPTYTMAMTLVEESNEITFTKKLWSANNECIVVFPDGVGLLPWEVCGTPKIGMDTAKKMRDFRVVVWATHGIFATGNNIDDAFGLIETVEKTARVYMIAKTAGPLINAVTDDQLKQLVDYFHVTDKVKKGWLDSIK